MSTLITTTAQIGTIKDAGGNNTAMTVDSTGRVLQPAKPSFRVSKANNQSISNGTNTKVTWDSEHWDIGSNFDISNDKFVVPIAGIYHFDCLLRLTGSGGTMEIGMVKIYRNGSLYSDLFQLHVAANQMANSHIGGGIDMQLSATDYIEIYGYIEGSSLNVGGISDTYGSRCWWSGHLVG